MIIYIDTYRGFELDISPGALQRLFPVTKKQRVRSIDLIVQNEHALESAFIAVRLINYTIHSSLLLMKVNVINVSAATDT